MENTKIYKQLYEDKMGKRQILITGICLLFNMVDGFDITVMSVAVDSIGKTFQVESNVLGLLFSFALAGMMVGAMLVAPMADIIGRRKLILGSLIVITISVALTALASSLYSMVGLRFFSGIGAGALLATQASLVSEYSNNKYRTLCVTLVTAGYPLGAMLTGVIAELIMPHYGWHGLFWLGAILTGALFLVAVVWIPESLSFLLKRQPQNALQKINNILNLLKRPLLDKLPVPDCLDIGSNDKIILRKLFANNLFKKTLLLWVVFCCCSSTLYFLMSWIPKLTIQLGFDTTVSYQVFSIFSMGGVVGILIFGLLSSRFGLTTLVGTFLLSAAGLMLTLSQIEVNKTALFLLIALIGFTLQSGYNGLYAVATKLYPTEIRNTGVGWALGVGRLGAVIAPVVAGVLISLNVAASSNILFFSIPILLSGILAFKIGLK